MGQREACCCWLLTNTLELHTEKKQASGDGRECACQMWVAGLCVTTSSSHIRNATAASPAPPPLPPLSVLVLISHAQHIGIRTRTRTQHTPVCLDDETAKAGKMHTSTHNALLFAAARDVLFCSRICFASEKSKGKKSQENVAILMRDTTQRVNGNGAV